MKYLNLTKQIAALAISALVFASCDKVDVQGSIGDSGQTLVKLLGGGTPYNISKSPVDFVATPTKILAVDVRRDIPNPTELNTTMNITVKDDVAAVATAGYVLLPAAWYTIGSSTPRTGGVGGNYNIVMAPGEFSKPIYITIPDATLLDPSTLYGLGFTITAADDNGVISTQKAIVVEIGAKNDYDGVYHITGTLSDVSTVAGANVFGPWAPFWEALLITTGANSVDVNDNTYTGIVAHPFFSVPATSTPSYFGAFGMMVSFNPATKAISDLHNYYGDPTRPANFGGNPAAGTGPPDYAASNTRRAVIDPSGTNSFDPGTHNITAKYWMLQSSVMGSNTPRIYFNETWTYVGSR